MTTNSIFGFDAIKTTKKDSSSLGIYFGKESLDLVLLHHSAKEINVEGTLSIELNGSEEDEAISSQLENFVRQLKCNNLEIYAGISRQDTVFVYMDLPAPTEENLREAIGYELDRYTPYSNEDAYYDVKILRRDSEKNSIHVLLAAARKEQIKTYLKILEKAGITPKAIEPESTALVDAFIQSGNREKGRYVLVNVGVEINEVLLVEEGQLAYSRFFSTIPALQSELTLALTRNHWQKESITSIVVGGDESGDILSTLEKTTGIKTVSLEKLPCDSEGHFLAHRGLAAYVMALRGFRKNHSFLNLIPEVKVEKVKRKTHWTIIPLILLTLSLWAAFLVTPMIQSGKSLQALSTEVDRLKKETKPVEELQRDIASFDDKLSSLNLIKSKSFSGLEIMKELTRIIPVDTWLTEIKIKGSRLEISGYSTSAASLVAPLEKSPFFKNTEFSAPVTVSEKSAPSGFKNTGRTKKAVVVLGMEEFKIRLTLEIVK